MSFAIEGMTSFFSWDVLSHFILLYTSQTSEAIRLCSKLEEHAKDWNAWRTAISSFPFNLQMCVEVCDRTLRRIVWRIGLKLKGVPMSGPPMSAASIQGGFQPGDSCWTENLLNGGFCFCFELPRIWTNGHMELLIYISDLY